MKQKSFYQLLLLNCIMVPLTFMSMGCTKELDKVDDEEGITFFISEGGVSENYKEGNTRGAQATTASLTSFGMTATVYPSGQTYTGQSLGNYFYNLQVQPGVAMSYYWPTANYRIAFYGYAPYGNAAITMSAKGTSGPPSYTYTVPENPASQVDFMTTQVTDRSCGTRTAVPLTFTHRLSDIRVTAYNQQNATITVKSISIFGMKYVGTLTGNTWALSGSANSISSHPFTLSMNTAITSGSTVDLTGTNNHFMVIPQTVASGTDMIRVVTTEGGAERVYTHRLSSAKTFAMGMSYTYRLTLGNGQMLVSAETDVADWYNPFDYLKFTAIQAGTFTLRIGSNVPISLLSSISYSTDNGSTWVKTNNADNTTVTITTPTIAAGNSVLWRGVGTGMCSSWENNNYYSVFSSTGRFNASGSIMSLLYGENLASDNTLSSPRTFQNLFSDCTGLVTPPDLPATTIAVSCYEKMFLNCTNLTTAPALPATVIPEWCYSEMFKGCTSLTTAPDLPGTRLEDHSYNMMFQGCTSLSYIKMLATNTSASDCLNSWVENVSGSGTFVKSYGASLPSGIHGIPSGWSVQNE